MTYEELEDLGYDFKQINQILKAQDLGLDFSKLNVQVSANTMRKIVEMNPTNFDADRIRLLANCVKNNFDCTYVLDTKRFNYKQAAQIVDSMFKGINYDVIANPQWSSNQMKSAKNALVAGVDEEIISLVNPSQLKKYLELATKASHYGYNIKNDLREGYDASQIPVLLNAHNEKIDLKSYITSEFDAYQILEVLNMIKHVKKHGLDIDITDICKKEFTPNAMKKLFSLKVGGKAVKELYSGEYNKGQINVINIAIQKELDYKILLNPELSAEQMNMILCGMQLGLDAKLYADKNLSAPIMKAIFDNLKYNRDNPGNQIDITLLIHPELTHQQVLKFAKILKTGTLDEKLEVMKKHNELVAKNNKMVKEKEQDINK